MRVPCRAPSRFGAAALAAFAALVIAACSPPRDSIVVDEGMVFVENQTDEEWRDVRITVNHHFTGSVSTLAPGGRITAPLSQFQTGLGQKFDRGRQSVFKVEVTAKAANGNPVTLTWGADPPK